MAGRHVNGFSSEFCREILLEQKEKRLNRSRKTRCEVSSISSSSLTSSITNLEKNSDDHPPVLELAVATVIQAEGQSSEEMVMEEINVIEVFKKKLRSRYGCWNPSNAF